MIPFTIYLTATGQILRYGAVWPQDIGSQCQAGESILTGVQGNPAAQKVDVTQNPPVLVSRE
jgi:hypothetical protein